MWPKVRVKQDHSGKSYQEAVNRITKSSEFLYQHYQNNRNIRIITSDTRIRAKQLSEAARNV